MYPSIGELTATPFWPPSDVEPCHALSAVLYSASMAVNSLWEIILSASRLLARSYSVLAASNAISALVTASPSPMPPADILAMVSDLPVFCPGTGIPPTQLRMPEVREAMVAEPFPAGARTPEVRIAALKLPGLTVATSTPASFARSGERTISPWPDSPSWACASSAASASWS